MAEAIPSFQGNGIFFELIIPIIGGKRKRFSGKPWKISDITKMGCGFLCISARPYVVFRSGAKKGMSGKRKRILQGIKKAPPFGEEKEMTLG